MVCCETLAVENVPFDTAESYYMQNHCRYWTKKFLIAYFSCVLNSIFSQLRFTTVLFTWFDFMVLCLHYVPVHLKLSLSLNVCAALPTLWETWVVMSCVCIIFFDQVQLRTEVLRTPSSTRLGFELMTSISWQYISIHVTETPALTTWPPVTSNVMDLNCNLKPCHRTENYIISLA